MNLTNGVIVKTNWYKYEGFAPTAQYEVDLMLYFIMTWTVLTGVCFVTGVAVLNAFQANCFERSGDRFMIAVWLGVVVLAITLLATSLILPLSPLVGVIVAVIFISLSLLSTRTKTEIVAFGSSLSPRLILGFLFLEVAVAALMTQQVTWYDAGLYHFGSIHWLAKYGAVPGVALINSKFGFTSSWFAFAAPLNPERLASHTSAITNGFAFLLASLHFFISLNHIFKTKGQLSDWLVSVYSLIVLPLCIFTTFMSAILISPSPDMAVILLTGVIAWAILLISKTSLPPLPQNKIPSLDASAIPLILSGGAVTMKLSALPLLVVSALFYVIGRQFNLKRIFWGSAIISLLLLPMALFGLITSGCPLYPSTLMCINLPWTITGQNAVAEAEAINGWKSWVSPPPPGTNPWLWVLGEWLKLASFNKVMILLIIISLILTIYSFKTAKLSKISGEIWLIALAGLGMAFIMVKAPLIRFGLGYFIIIPSLLVAKFCYWKLSNSIPKLISSSLARGMSHILLVLPLFLTSLGLVAVVHSDGTSRLLIPPELPRDKVLTSQVNDIEYVYPKTTDKCWAAELPCAPEPITQTIRLRDPRQGIGGGFVHVK